ncbi:MAG TPA: LacI family transcriptional regulator [Lachnospiraceae bacterium]|nr:LacI family transcriptional regulator [Lachnospiraceae bacterium]
MATLKDVAKLACVDVSTVSRALNGTSYVHPDTKARIMKAVEELSYRPNVLAQGLRKGKRHTIAIVVPILHMTIFEDLAQELEAAARDHGYSCLLCHTNDDPATERECLRRLQNGFVDGMVIAATGKNTRLLRDIHADGIAMIQIVRRQDNTISSVVGDYEGGSYETVKYLYGKGCRAIGLINGPMLKAPYKARFDGYHRAVRDLGLEEIFTREDLRDGITNSFEYGYSCTEELLDLHPNLDAIMAAVDIQGMAALKVLKNRGIRVPQQMRVVSLTGYSIGNYLETTMTSQELPARQMAEKAVEMLIEEIEAKPEKKPGIRNLVFNTSLTERESS